jgi:hypothetical protein
MTNISTKNLPETTEKNKNQDRIQTGCLKGILQSINSHLSGNCYIEKKYIVKTASADIATKVSRVLHETFITQNTPELICFNDGSE